VNFILSGDVHVTSEWTTVRFVSDTTAVTDRPYLRVRRDKLRRLLPDGVRSASDLAEFFGLSRSVAWRLFCSPDEMGYRPSVETVAAICTRFPDVLQSDLIEVVAP
jgi:hypothetical protein